MLAMRLQAQVYPPHPQINGVPVKPSSSITGDVTYVLPGRVGSIVIEEKVRIMMAAERSWESVYVPVPEVTMSLLHKVSKL